MFNNLIIALIALLISITVLLKGSNLALSSASRIGRHFNVSKFIIGLTLVALGTSLPELANAIAASLSNNPGIIMGDIIGSNIANIGLVLALTLIFLSIRVKKQEFERVYMMLLSLLLFSLFSTDLIISRPEAIILFGSFVLYLNGVFKKIKAKFPTYREYFLYFDFKRLLSFKILGSKDKEKREAFFYEVIRDFFIFFFGMALVSVGAKFTVISAVDIAYLLKVPQAFIAATMLAIGTSLPELSVTLAGIRQGHHKLVFGNIVGSNIFNTLAVVGIAGLLNPIEIQRITLNFLIPAMLAFSFLLLLILKKTLVLKKFHGRVLLVLYLAFIFLLLELFFGLVFR